VRRGAARVLLQAADTAAPVSLAAQVPGGCDVLLLVDDVEATWRELDARGAHVTSREDDPGGTAARFDVRDPSGNVLRFEPTLPTALGQARRLARRHVPVRLRDDVRQRLTAREERPHLNTFRRFYRELSDKQDIFYITFRSGLLHWVAKAVSHVPPDVNLVLLGTALPEDEREWLARHVPRPFHHIDLVADDKTVWEFLFSVNERNFGALDTDCFVLDPRLFAQMAQIKDDVAINCAWSVDSQLGFRVAQSHFLFLNVEPIRALRRAGVPISPCTYDWRGESRRVQGRHCYSRVPTQRQREMMLQISPPDPQGRPRIPWDGTFFDTLVVYQLLAMAAGYRIECVRMLEREVGQPTIDGDRPQPFSDELLHIGGASFYDRFFHAPEVRPTYITAELSVLAHIVDALPPGYAQRRDKLVAELATAGIDLDSAGEGARARLRSAGLSEQAIERTLAPAF
jgi:hypothetical protein